jgi:hypothetical protein
MVLPWLTAGGASDLFPRRFEIFLFPVAVFAHHHVPAGLIDDIRWVAGANKAARGVVVVGTLGDGAHALVVGFGSDGERAGGIFASEGIFVEFLALVAEVELYFLLARRTLLLPAVPGIVAVDVEQVPALVAGDDHELLAAFPFAFSVGDL